MNTANFVSIPAMMFPDQEILVFENHRRTYGQLWERIQRLANALDAAGVGRGDRVAALQTNSAHYVEAYFATAALGAVFIPVNYRAKLTELEYMLGAANTKVLLVGDRYVDAMRQIAAEVQAGRLAPADIDEQTVAKAMAWNAKYAAPRVVIGLAGEYFAAFEQRHGAKLPVASGDLTPYWEDGAASSALETAMNRASADRLTQAETLFAMFNPKAYPAEDFYQAWRNVILCPCADSTDFRWTVRGSASAIFWPKQSSDTSSEMRMTSDMSCSTRSTVTPRSRMRSTWSASSSEDLWPCRSRQ